MRRVRGQVLESTSGATVGLPSPRHADVHPFAPLLDKPAVPPAGEIEGKYYISMALIEGHSLAARLEGGGLDTRETAELVCKLARGLAAVHAEGIVHRDVQPSNVIIDRSGEPLLMDFGLARQPERESDLPSGDSGSGRQSQDGSYVASTGGFVGTLPYVSPEQAKGEAADARSDLYSLGVLLYQMLTGRLPFAFRGSLDELLKSPGLFMGHRRVAGRPAKTTT